jgi:hypothetical protein
MAAFKPSAVFSVPLMLLVPTYSKVQGVTKKSFPALEEGVLFYGNFKTYGGTERDVNGIYSVEDTAIIETWYLPHIKNDCRIGVPSTGAIYEVFGEPENINMRNQYMKFKVRRVKGGA